jgi:hypothetical protein
MLTVSTASVLNGVFKRVGITPSDASTADVEAMLDMVSDRLATAKEYYRWPVYTIIEQRFFRPLWLAGSTYAADAEVYYEPTDKYYVCLSATSAGQDPEDTPAKWEEMENFNHQVDYAQAGETRIAVVLGAWDADPRAYPDALELKRTLRQDGVGFEPDLEATSVWLEYMAPADSLAAEVFDAAATYAVNELIYWTDGEVYKCIVQTTAGQDPTDTPASWELVPFPAFLARAVKAGALKDWNVAGEKEQSAKLEQLQEDAFQDLLDEQVFLVTKMQGQTGRPNVQPHG